MSKSYKSYITIVHDFIGELDKCESINAVAWALVNKTFSALHYHDCVLYLYDEEFEVLNQVAAFGPKALNKKEVANPISIIPGQGIVGSVFVKAKGEIVANTLSDARYVVDDAVRLSEMAIPIMYNHKVIGVLDCEHPEENFFDPIDFSAVSIIAEIVGARIMEVMKNKEVVKDSTRGVDIAGQIEKLPEEQQACKNEIPDVINQLNALNKRLMDVKKDVLEERAIKEETALRIDGVYSEINKIKEKLKEK